MPFSETKPTRRAWSSPFNAFHKSNELAFGVGCQLCSCFCVFAVSIIFNSCGYLGSATNCVVYYYQLFTIKCDYRANNFHTKNTIQTASREGDAFGAFFFCLIVINVFLSLVHFRVSFRKTILAK